MLISWFYLFFISLSVCILKQIAALDCISKCVVGNAENEEAFADSDGMDLLFELLEVSPCVLRTLVRGHCTVL